MKFLIARLRRSLLWRVTFAALLACTLYWTLFAARRYVSESHVVIENLQAPSSTVSVDLPSLLTGSSPPKDIMLLRDYLQSADMLAKLEERLKLREHYSSSYDLFSRLLYRDIPFEWFLRHYRSRVLVEYDEYSGVLVIQAQAYSPEMARAIGATLLDEGERFMNELAHRLAREQMAFAEAEVVAAGRRMSQARQALLTYQDRHGLVSPTGTVDTISAVVGRLDSDLSTLLARRRAMEAYLAPDAPDLVTINQQVRALEQQLVAERKRLAATQGNPLNRVAEEYDRLVFDAGFQQDMYKTALGALERARIDASRMLRKLSVLQQPTLPQYSDEPPRVYNTVLYALALLVVAGILNLLIVIIREHRS